MKLFRVISVLFLAVFFACSPQGGPPESSGENAQSGPPSEGEASSGPPTQGPPSQDALRAVEGYTLTSGQLVDEVVAAGTVRGIREAVLVSQTQGQITSDNMVLGQRLEPGDVIIQVDSEIARISMEQAESVYENARLDYEASQTLFDTGSASRAELNRAASAMNGAKANYQRALKAYEDTSITVPFSGYVAQKESVVGVGNTLAPGAPLGTFVDLSSLRMDLGVGEGEIAFIQRGAEANIEVDSLGRSYVGEVTQVAAGADSRTGSFRFVVEFTNPETNGVRSGLSARARISVETDQQLIVPSFALIRQGAESYVLKYTESGIEKVLFLPTEIRANRMVGVSDLQEGDVVITSGLSLVRPGDEVELSVLGNSGELQ